MSKNVIVDKSFQFALEIMSYSELLETQKKFVFARQILRSGTAVGACVRESQGAESKRDFVHRLKMADKEANETVYWLLLCKHSPDYPNCGPLMDQLIEIKKLLSAIISSSKKTEQLTNKEISTLTN